jgi:hypothetical protein
MSGTVPEREARRARPAALARVGCPAAEPHPLQHAHARELRPKLHRRGRRVVGACAVEEWAGCARARSRPGALAQQAGCAARVAEAALRLPGGGCAPLGWMGRTYLRTCIRGI